MFSLRSFKLRSTSELKKQEKERKLSVRGYIQN